MRVKLAFDLFVDDLLRGTHQLNINIILSSRNHLQLK